MPRTVIEEDGGPAAVERGNGPLVAAVVVLVLTVLGLFLFFGANDGDDGDATPGGERGVTSSEAPSEEPTDEPTAEPTDEATSEPSSDASP